MQFAIMVGVSIGLSVISSALQSKPKQTPIDRGKQDDLRFTIVEEGAFIPRVYGKQVRLGGNIFWGTPTDEHVTSTPGSSGGKKGRGAEPPTNNYFYDKSFAVYFCEGPIRAFLRITEGEKILFNQVTAPFSSYYEAEATANTLAGGASIIADSSLLSGFKVRLPAGASVTFNGVRANIVTTAMQLGIYYQSDVNIPTAVLVNGVGNYAPTLFDTNNALFAVDEPIILQVSSTNTIKITNSHASAVVDIDRIFLFPGHEDDDDVTGVIDDGAYPANLDNPALFYNQPLRVDPRGQANATLSSGGQAEIELFLGTEDQEPPATMVTAEGAANVPAHRGLAGFVVKDYQVNNGQLGNVTAEVEPLLSNLAATLAAEFKLRGATDAQLDFAALSAIEIEGLYIDRLAPLTETLEALKIFFNFDIVPADGKIKAVLRGGASVRTIPHHELLAHQEGEDRPAGIRIEHIESSDLPGGVYVAYIDPSQTKDFHSGDQFVPLGFGSSLEAETINLPLVITDPNAVVAFGKRWLFGQHLEKDPHAFSLSPKHRDLIPTDVVTLQLPQNDIEVRLIGTQAMMPGLVKARALPEKAGLYNQTGIGQIGTGTENRKVPFPANTFLHLIDSPPARDADEGLFFYAAGCPRGLGNYQGHRLYEETIPGSDEFHLHDSFPQPATIGKLLSALPAVTDLASLDHVNSVVLDLYFDESLFESRPESDIRARDVNLLILGSGPFVNFIKFTTATYSAGTSPFVRRVTLTGLLHGVRGTRDGARNGTAAGTAAVLLTDSVRKIPDQLATLGEARTFKGPTVGQALVDAPETLFTNFGNSLRPLHMSDEQASRETGGDFLITAIGNPRPSEEPAEYVCQVWTSEDRSTLANLKLELPMVTGTTQAALMASTGSTYLEKSGFTSTTHAFKNNLTDAAIIPVGCVGTTLQAIEQTFQRLDFEMTMDQATVLPDTSFGGNFGAALHKRPNADGPFAVPVAGDCPISIEWTIPTNYYNTHPEGTVRETYRSYSTILKTIEGVDPGYNPFQYSGYVPGDDIVDLGGDLNRPGPRYTFLLNGNELAVYKNFKPAGGNRHIVKVTLSKIEQLTLLPLRLTAWMPNLAGVSNVYLRNLMFGGALQPSTIISGRDQIQALGSRQKRLFLRLFQKSRFPQVGEGFPLDLVVPPFPALDIPPLQIIGTVTVS